MLFFYIINILILSSALADNSTKNFEGSHEDVSPSVSPNFSTNISPNITQMSTGSEMSTGVASDANTMSSPRRSYDVIHASKISPDVVTTLNQIPGLQLLSTSSGSQTKNYSIRGAPTENLLVLWDDVVLNDPLSPTGAFDFSSIDLSQVERVELLRGPEVLALPYAPVLGVLRFVSKSIPENNIQDLENKANKESDNPNIQNQNTQNKSSKSKFNIRYGFSELKERSLSLAGSGAIKKVYFSGAYTQKKSANISAASELQGNTEADRSIYKEFLHQTKFVLSDKFKTSLSFRAAKNSSQNDSLGGRGGDDPNEAASAKTIHLASRTEWKLFPDRTKLSLLASISKSSRHDWDLPDSTDPSERDSRYESSRFLLSPQLDFILSANHKLRILAAYEEDRGFLRESSSVFPTQERKGLKFSRSRVSLSHEYQPGDFLSIQSIRLEDDLSSRMRLGGASWSPSYRVKSTKTLFRSQYGFFQRAPSLYQRESSYGNKSLKPETIRSFDIGVEQKFLDHEISLSYFENNFSKWINFNFASYKYENLDEATMKGLEAKLSLWSDRNISFTLSHTYLETWDRRNKQELLRRPKHSSFLESKWNINSNLSWLNELERTGSRVDVDPISYSRLKMPSFVLVHSILHWQKKFQTYGINASLRLSNIFNKQYERISGFSEPGRYLGVDLGTNF